MASKVVTRSVSTVSNNNNDKLYSAVGFEEDERDAALPDGEARRLQEVIRSGCLVYFGNRRLGFSVAEAWVRFREADEAQRDYE